ncbi:MAG: hypothetical protein RL318_1997 [Fibrobacterota bacterium]|jgi:hypothetical protein
MNDREFQSASQRLREARLAEGWELELVSQQTKIPMEFLRHIEDGAWDRLPGAVYARAFVKTLAGLYGLDQDLVVRLLRHELNLDKDVVASPSEVITNFTSTPGESPVPAQKPVGMMIAMGAIAVVLGGVLYFTQVPGQEAPAPAPILDTATVDTLLAEVAPQAPAVPVPVPVAGGRIKLQDTSETVMVLCLRDRMVMKKSFHGQDSLEIPKDTVLTFRNLSGKYLRMAGKNGRDSLAWKFFEAGSVGDSFWVRSISEEKWSRRYDGIVSKERKKKRE